MKTRFILLLGGVLLLALFGRVLRSQAAIFQIGIARTNANIVLTSNNPRGARESTLVLPGQWSLVTGAVSPRVIAPTNPASFFRLQVTNTSTSFAALYVAPTFS